MNTYLVTLTNHVMLTVDADNFDFPPCDSRLGRVNFVFGGKISLTIWVPDLVSIEQYDLNSKAFYCVFSNK